MSKVPLMTRIRNKMRDIRHNWSVRIRGTKQYEKEWSAKECDKFYWDSREHPHRALLMIAISRFSPDSVLEIGCNSGPNLYKLAKIFPNAKLHGIDVSQKAIDEGRTQLEKCSIINVSLELGKADDLSKFEDRSIDVVVSDAVMIYIGKDKIEKVVKEMLRVARKAIILVEWHDTAATTSGSFLFKRGYWTRDYVSLFKGRDRVEDIQLTKITRDIWNDECWSKYGHVIEVALRNE